MGVIGIIGLDARSVILPSYVEGLDFRDPIPYVRKAVKELKPLVDVIVVLTHHGKQGHMQSAAENLPEVVTPLILTLLLNVATPETLR